MSILTHIRHCRAEMVGKWPHQYRVFYRAHNEALFQKLEEDGFFRLHTTNKGAMVGEHQVVAFYYRGGKAALEKHGFECRKGEIEVHHKDGNTLNNHWSNLVYVPAETHAQITRHQRAVHRYIKKFREGNCRPYLIWNSKGEPVVRFAEWFTNLLVSTILKTAKTNGIEILVKPLALWVRRILKWARLGLDTSRISTTMIIKEALT